MLRIAVEDAIEDVVAQITPCPKCGRYFFKVHKREFCSTSCRDILKTNRYRARLRAQK